MPKPKCVVTGAGGFIGSNMVRFLRERGHYVVGVDVNYPEFRRSQWSCDVPSVFDLREPKDLDTLLSHGDWVFHFAAQMGGVGIFHGPKDQEYARENARINLNVLDALRPEQRLFFSSSACMYPVARQRAEDTEHVLSEWSIGLGPADQLYGEEKRMMTMLCYKQPNARVGILHTIYGPYQEYEGERMKFPTAITRKVIEAKNLLSFDGPPTGRCTCSPGQVSHVHKVGIWGDGTQVRSFLFIQDALEKIYRVMDSEKYEGPTNIGSDEEVTVKEVADALCKEAGIKPHYVYDKTKPTGVLARSSDNSKFERVYGKVPQTPTKVGFAKLYSWMKTQIEEDARGMAAQTSTESR